MATVTRFLQAVMQNAARVTEYHQPGDGSDGLCDCIGLIIGAVRLTGGEWTGTHGSNYAARSMIDGLGPAKFFKGEIVFKVRNVGEARYKLPEKYKQGGSRFNGDLLDYYHVGVVISDKPLKIIHCTDPGPIVVDTKAGKWTRGGRLKGIDYETSDANGEPSSGIAERERENMSATVYAENGKPVKMRIKPNTSTNVYWEIPVGDFVDVLEPGETWSKIKHNGRIGYMMSKFLKTDETAEETPEETVEVKKDELTAAYDKIGELLKQFVVNKGELEKVYDSIGDMLGLRG